MDSDKLDHLYESFEKAASEMAGYPLSQMFDYSKVAHFLKFHVNNLGDPFIGNSYYRINTLSIEKEIIDIFAQLFNAEKDNYWGYVTNGGTEGNLYGLYVARERFPEGIVFYSDQTHYSIPKNLRLLRMKGVKVPAQPHGEIDYQALRELIIKEKKTPIILANIGTTMKGAVDDVVRIKEILKDCGIHEYYIHCDAAFFGMILPFIPEIESQHYDFRVGINSISISGHKMIGTPMPCGVVLVRKTDVDQIGQYIEYVGIKDNTISGSRNGLSPLFLWHELKSSRKKNFQNVVRDCLDRAEYAVQKFKDLGIHAWRNPNSIIVVFPRPTEQTIRKWQLAVEKDIAHMITLPHLSKKIIDTIIKEVVQDLKSTIKNTSTPLTTYLP